MGLPLPLNAPQIVVAGRTYGVGAFLWNTPDGQNYMIGVYELTATGWQFVAPSNSLVQYSNPGQMVADVKIKGGRVAYFKWIETLVNALFQKMFAGVTPESLPDEPTTDDQAIAQIAASFGGMHLTLVNGVPQLV